MIMSNDLAIVLEKLEKLADRLAIIERAPSLHRHVSDSQIVSRVKNVMSLVAKLVGQDAHARGATILATTATMLKEAAENSTMDDRIAITDDLEPAPRGAFMRWLDPSARIQVACAQIDPGLVPELVILENRTQHTIEWACNDARGLWLAGRQMLGFDKAVQVRSDFERECALMEDVAAHIKGGRLAVIEADDTIARQWLIAAVAEGERFTLSQDFRVVPVDGTRTTHTSATLAAETRRSAERVQVADYAARAESATANKEAISKRTRSQVAKR